MTSWRQECIAKGATILWAAFPGSGPWTDEIAGLVMTKTGSPVSEAGPFGTGANCLRFPSVSDYATVPDNALLDWTTGTVIVVVRRDADTGADSCILTKGTTGGNGHQMAFLNTDKLGMAKDGVAILVQESGTTSVGSSWITAGMSHSGAGTGKFHKNGSDVSSSVDGTQALTATTVALYVGVGTGGGSQRIAGSIAGIAYFPTVLSTSDHLAIHNAVGNADSSAQALTSVGGIASAEALGNPTLGSGAVALTSVGGIASAQAFGAPLVGQGRTKRPARNFQYPDDSVEAFNAVLVLGAEGLKVWRPAVLPPAGTRRDTVIKDDKILTVGEANAAGDLLLASQVNRNDGSFDTWYPGLRAGQIIHIKNSDYGIDGDFPITEVTTDFLGNDQTMHHVSFGAVPVRLIEFFNQPQNRLGQLAHDIGEINQSIVDLSVGGGNMVRNSSFEDGSDWSVGAGWTMGFDPAGPDEAFHGSKVARLVSSGNPSGLLYTTAYIPVERSDHWWASVWRFIRARTGGEFRFFVDEVNAALGVITTTTVAVATGVDAEWIRMPLHFAPSAGAGVDVVWNVSTKYVRLGFYRTGSGSHTVDVDGVQVERGMLLTAYAPAPYELLDGSVGTTEIADNAVTTPKVIANAIVAGKIAAAAVGTNELQALSVVADKIAAGAIRADKMSIGSSSARSIAPNFSFEDFDPVYPNLPYLWTDFSGGPGSSFAFGEPGGSEGARRLVLYSDAAGGGNYAQTNSPWFPITAGQEYYCSSKRQAIGNSPTTGAVFVISWGDAAFNPVGTPAYIVNFAGTTAGSWIKGDGYATPPAGAVWAIISLYNYLPNVAVYLAWDEIVILPSSGGVVNAAGTVLINAAGIAVKGGKISVEDQYGIAGAVTGAGFGGSWTSFVAPGLYNSDFDYGSAADLPATIVGTASTLADYAASATSQLPYWIVSDSSGSIGIASGVTGASNGKALRMNTGLCTFLQDAVIRPGRRYGVVLRANATVPAASLVYVDLSITYRDANHAKIGTRTDFYRRMLAPADAGVWLDLPMMLLSSTQDDDPPPNGTVYERIEIAVYLGSGSGTWGFDIDAVGLVESDAWVHTIRTAEPSYLGFNPNVYRAAADLTLTTSFQTISCVRQSDSTEPQAFTASALRAYVIATFDFECSAAGAGVLLGQIYYNGAAIATATQATGNGGAVSRASGTCMGVVDIPAGAAGPSIQLAARKTVAGGTAKIYATQTHFIVIPFANVVAPGQVLGN